MLSMSAGYVLRFSDKSFHAFILNAVQLDINSRKYKINGTSKANRLRTFWDIEADATVGKLIEHMLLYHHANEKIKNEPVAFNQQLFEECLDIAYRLQGKKQLSDYTNEAIESFLKKEVNEISIRSLKLDSTAAGILQQRMDEVKKCLEAKANLSVIFLCSNILEGLLVSIATNHQREFIVSAACPKYKDTGEPKPFHEWSLNHLVEVAYDAGFIGPEVKKFNHSLRDVRNYIAPFQSVHSDFNPDTHAAAISWQVLKTAIHDLSVK